MNVSSDTPTYGASRRPARISSTSTAPEAVNTIAPARRLSIARTVPARSPRGPRSRRPAALRGSGATARTRSAQCGRGWRFLRPWAALCGCGATSRTRSALCGSVRRRRRPARRRARRAGRSMAQVAAAGGRDLRRSSHGVRAVGAMARSTVPLTVILAGSADAELIRPGAPAQRRSPSSADGRGDPCRRRRAHECRRPRPRRVRGRARPAARRRHRRRAPRSPCSSVGLLVGDARRRRRDDDHRR